jgi:hypothetical protein
MENNEYHHIGSHIHFAGEAWNSEFQGFMEGAVRSGEAAAKYVLDSITESEQNSSSKLIVGAIGLTSILNPMVGALFFVCQFIL